MMKKKLLSLALAGMMVLGLAGLRRQRRRHQQRCIY